jgi:hypothetical protein
MEFTDEQLRWFEELGQAMRDRSAEIAAIEIFLVTLIDVITGADPKIARRLRKSVKALIIEASSPGARRDDNFSAPGKGFIRRVIASRSLRMSATIWRVLALAAVRRNLARSLAIVCPPSGRDGMLPPELPRRIGRYDAFRDEPVEQRAKGGIGCVKNEEAPWQNHDGDAAVAPG